MSDLNHAQRLIQLAQIDLQAIENMLDSSRFSDSVFGFHAQQAVEKALKAWMSLLGIKYPLTHDLKSLFQELEALHKSQVIPHLALVELTDFGVAFRYDLFDESPLARDVWLKQVAALVSQVKMLIQNKSV